MTEKQDKFCREYILDFNAAAAARRAGYSEKTSNRIASRLLSKVDIQAYIADLKHIAAVESRVTPQWILSKLEKIARMGLGEDDTHVVVKDSVGNGVTETVSQKLTKADLAASKSALDLLGRYHGIFTDNTKVEHSGQIIRRIINVNPSKDGK